MRSFFEDELRLPMPDFADGLRDSPLAKAIAFRDALAGCCKKVAAPEPCDIVMFGTAGHFEHCGIVIDPVRREMLHSNKPNDHMSEASSTVARYGGLLWHPVGFWRYSPPAS
jgi:hypothetical protein